MSGRGRNYVWLLAARPREDRGSALGVGRALCATLNALAHALGFVATTEADERLEPQHVTFERELPTSMLAQVSLQKFERARRIRRQLRARGIDERDLVEKRIRHVRGLRGRMRTGRTDVGDVVNREHR